MSDLLSGAQHVTPPNLYSVYVYEHYSLGSPGKRRMSGV